MKDASKYLEFILSLATPSADQRHSASRHRNDVETHLRRDLGVFRIFETGSWSHGTAVAPWSDVDYFASMPGTRPLASHEDLERLRISLANHFRSNTVRLSRPVVQVWFEGGPTVEITPAHITSDDDYFIPDPTGPGWIKSSPTKHKDYVNKARDKEPAAKNFIRLLKEWKYQNKVPIPSLYLEMRGAKHVMDHPPLIHHWDLCLFFEALDRGGLPDMNDPSNFDGRRIPSVTPSGNKESAKRHISIAARATRLALDATTNNHHELAVDALEVLFSP